MALGSQEAERPRWGEPRRHHSNEFYDAQFETRSSLRPVVHPKDHVGKGNSERVGSPDVKVVDGTSADGRAKVRCLLDQR